MQTRTQRGFTLLELLISVTIIGVLASIAIPGLMNALDRGRQKRTMADLKTLAEAIEAYAVDNSVYPTAATMTELSVVLRPVFARAVPVEDGWGHGIVVDCAAGSYTVGSGGKDGGALDFVGGPTTDFDDAIILSNGQFVQWPEGAQR